MVVISGGLFRLDDVEGFKGAIKVDRGVWFITSKVQRFRVPVFALASYAAAGSRKQVKPEITLYGTRYRV